MRWRAAGFGARWNGKEGRGGTSSPYKGHANQQSAEIPFNVVAGAREGCQLKVTMLCWGANAKPSIVCRNMLNPPEWGWYEGGLNMTLL